MHYASSIGELKKDQVGCGWKIDENAQHDWNAMVQGVQSHITVIFL